jgi:YihY family inner membrane protein
LLFQAPEYRPGFLPRASDLRLTLKYALQTEVHVYAFSIAANVLLSFFPFLIVMVSFCRYVLGWAAAEQAIYVALADFFPDRLGEFIQHNLRVTVNSRGPMQWISLLLLMFTANGIFEPLEVALNRAWEISKNRSYVHNQLVSLGLIFIVGALALVSTVLTAYNQQVLLSFGLPPGAFSSTIFKIAAIPMSIIALFVVYWRLPNGRIPAAPLVPVAVMVGAAIEALKNLCVLTWPWLSARFRAEYGPFAYSATIVFWSFLASMIVLAGAEWAARSRNR